MTNNIRLEVDMTTPQTPEQKDEQDYRNLSTYIDLKGLCDKLHLQWFSYREYEPNQEKVPENQRRYKVAYFLYEQGLETGVKFYRKREMAEMVCNFSIYKMVPNYSEHSLVIWAGQQGYRLSCTMSADRIKEKQRQRAHLEALENEVAKGELEALKAGVISLKEAGLEG